MDLGIIIVMDKRIYSIQEVNPVGDTSLVVAVRGGTMGKPIVENHADIVLLVAIVGSAIVVTVEIPQLRAATNTQLLCTSEN